MYLTKEELEFYNKNGFVIIENFSSSGDIRVMKMRMNYLLKNTPQEEINGIFTTGENELDTRNSYFLDSCDKIKIFLEEKAITDGKLNRPLELAVNKVAHALHKDSCFSVITHDIRFIQICQDLGIDYPLIAQSMYIFKPPEIGGKVKPHQDNSFLCTKPFSCVGFWIPLDDVTKENGCMWFIPGSHSLPLSTRFKRNTENVLYYDPPINYDLINIWPSESTPIETKKGSLVIFDGNLVHKSDENKSNDQRHVYTFHIIDKYAKWSKKNWLQYPNDISFDSL